MILVVSFQFCKLKKHKKLKYWNNICLTSVQEAPFYIHSKFVKFYPNSFSHEHLMISLLDCKCIDFVL